MKRFLMFVNDDFYPSGARYDFYKDFNTLYECLEAWKHNKEGSDWPNGDRYHILDTETGEWK
jgi:hypothetical protein